MLPPFFCKPADAGLPVVNHRGAVRKGSYPYAMSNRKVIMRSLLIRFVLGIPGAFLAFTGAAGVVAGEQPAAPGDESAAENTVDSGQHDPLNPARRGLGYPYNGMDWNGYRPRGYGYGRGRRGYGVGYPGYRGRGGSPYPQHRQYGNPPFYTDITTVDEPQAAEE